MLDDFWLRPHPFGITQPELTDAMTAQVEDYLGVRLPRAYLSLLRRLNGGVARRNAHWFAEWDFCCGTHSSFEDMLGIPRDLNLARSQREYRVTLAHSLEFTRAWEVPKRIIPITQHLADFEADCLDYRFCGPAGNPPVVFLTTQHGGPCGKGELLGEYKHIYVLPLAPDLETFVAGLFKGSRNHSYGIVGGGLPFEEVKGQLERTARRHATLVPMERNVSALDYPCAHRDKSVLAGWEFNRWMSYFHDEDIWPQLVLQPNMGSDEFLDFPEHGECEWVISSDISRVHRAELEQILDELPYPVVPLHIPDLKRLGEKGDWCGGPPTLDNQGEGGVCGSSDP